MCVTQVEINKKNRLLKSNSYYDAYVTAKIGQSIIRYKNKAVINLDDVRVSGSGIGDGVWEKLWENRVLEEVKRKQSDSNSNNEMGQTHQVHASHTAGHGSTATGMAASVVSVLLGVTTALFVYIF